MERNQRLAVALSEAEKERKEIVCLTKEHTDLTESDAYAILDELIDVKTSMGEKVVGYKLAYTSEAMRKQMGVEKPLYGMIFDYMLMDNGKELDMNSLIHPKVECELAFVLKHDIEGPDVTREDIIAATDYIVPALEIVDSRYKDYKFTMLDVIADNNSAAGVIVGEERFDLAKINLAEATVNLIKNGESVQTGSGTDVLGHPADALIWLARTCHSHGKKLEAGQMIISGGMTRAIDILPGDKFEADYGELGVVRFVASE